MKNIVIICSIFFLLGSSCKKNKDTITNQTVSGMVYNQCTDSGLAGVNVYLKINKDNQTVKNYETVSGINGAFSFTNAEMHSNTDYTYAIYIPSKSGTNGAGGTEVGFNGTSLSFNNSEANTFFQPRVTPKFLDFCFAISPAVVIVNPDSLVISFKQNVFHKNIPDLPYASYRIHSQMQNGITNCTFGNYPMGLWSITIDKWKSGLHTTTYDSLYLGWGATKTYTANW